MYHTISIILVLKLIITNHSEQIGNLTNKDTRFKT